MDVLLEQLEEKQEQTRQPCQDIGYCTCSGSNAGDDCPEDYMAILEKKGLLS
jgi:hypothetical protein